MKEGSQTTKTLQVLVTTGTNPSKYSDKTQR